MLRKIYNKTVGSKFFNKILFAYSLIIILTISMLTYIISSSISSILEKQSLSYNRQILSSVNLYFEDKCRTVKNIHQKIVESSDTSEKADFLLQYNGDLFADDYIDIRKSFERQMSDKLSMDKDITRFYLYNLSNNNYISFSRTLVGNREALYLQSIKENVQSNKTTDNNYKRIYMHPGTDVSSNSQKPQRIFSLFDFIRNKNDVSEILGTIIFDYDCDSLENSYSAYAQYLKGYILILTADGKVLYDSSNQYYRRAFPLYELIKNVPSGSVKYDKGVMNVIQNNQYGFTTIGVIPNEDLYKEINQLNEKIYAISFISLILILLLTYLSTKIFSKRIKIIINAIRQIQKGNLSTRIAEYSNDEIGEITSNLNNMCEQLSDYIDKEYVAGLRAKNAELKQNESLLRQKTAEMYALQAQINPHFLYNTLEAIRMKSLINKENDVAKMIQLLSTMFRNSIKKDMIVAIREELEFCKSYLDLYNIRYAGNLKLIYNVDSIILDYGILKHLLQPIIENSIIHGIDLAQEGNVIQISGYCSSDDLFIVISDNGSGLDSEQLEALNMKLKSTHIRTNDSIGITNVNYRIKLLYGEDYGITLQSEKDVGTKVTVKISVKTTKELNSLCTRY